MVPTDATTSAAHLYARVSTTKQKSNEDQDAENRSAADQHGWPIGHVYADVGSASAYGRKTRDGFEKLLSDLRGGVIRPGDVLILWEASRGSREQVEWATLLNLLRDKDIRVHITSHGRTYDLSNPRDRRTLDEDGTDSAYESGKTSMRVKRSAATNAAAGRPWGQVPFGYVRTFDPVTGRLAAQDIDPERAPIIRELFDRLEKGHSIRSITRDFAERGVVGRAGKPMSEQHLRKLALRPAYAGLRRSETSGQTVEAIWPAIVTPRQLHAVQAILSDLARVTRKPGNGKWFLSMIAVCGVCHGPLSVRLWRGVHKYRCHQSGHMWIGGEELDGIAERVILAFVNRKDILEQLAAAWDVQNERLEQIRADLAAVRGELRELTAAVGAGRLSLDFAAAAEPGIKSRIAKLEKQEAELSTPALLRGLVGVGLTLAQWRDKPMSTRREVARMLFSPEFLGTMAVHRATEARRVVFLTEKGIEYYDDEFPDVANVEHADLIRRTFGSGGTADEIGHVDGGAHGTGPDGRDA